VGTYSQRFFDWAYNDSTVYVSTSPAIAPRLEFNI